MHDTVRGTEDGEGMRDYEVAIFNPGGNRNQVSWLRVVNEESAAAELTITGVDDQGVASSDATPVRFMVPARAARTVSSQELESGDGLDAGALGDGTGKWRLLVRSDRPVQTDEPPVEPDRPSHEPVGRASPVRRLRRRPALGGRYRQGVVSLASRPIHAG